MTKPPGISENQRKLDELRKKRDRQRAVRPLIALARGDRLQASYAQQRMWFLHQLDPESAAYRMAFARLLHGPLDAEALRRAIEELVHRHESLRTVFPSSDGEPYQQIQPPSRWELVLEDHSSLEEATHARHVQQIASAEADRPIDLAVGPLFRTRLIRLAANEHLLLVTIHHIVSDGWSMDLFWRELGELYTASLTGQPPRLPPLPIGCADYAAWQRSWLQGDELARQVRYWKEQLEGAPAETALPFRGPRPSRQTFDGRQVRVELEVELSAHLHALSRREGVSLFMTLTAALRALLARYTGQEDLSIGTPIANRDRSETAGLIGLFVNTVVLRNHVRADDSFASLVAREKAVALSAFDHQETPFELVVEALGVERNLSRTPVFQIMYSHAEAAQAVQEIAPGLTTEQVRTTTLPAKFDLTVTSWEREGRITVGWIYNVDMFEGAMVEQMARHLRNLLAAAVKAPDRRVGELDLLDASERAALFDEPARRVSWAPRGPGVVEQIERAMGDTPAAPALIQDGRVVTYGDLATRTARLASVLRARGVGADRVVAVIAERGIEQIVGLVAVLRAGGAYVPIKPDLPADRIAWMLEDTAPVVILCGGPPPPAVARFADRIVRLDEPTTWPEVAAWSTSPAVPPDSLAYIIYTSGSTGRPKGVMLARRGFDAQLDWMQAEYKFTANDRMLQLASSQFDFSVIEIFWPLMIGGAIILPRVDGELEPAYLAELANEQVATHVHFVPSLLRLVVDTCRTTPWTTIRTVFTGGEALALDLARSARTVFPRADLHNQYGPTETTIDATFWTCRPEDETVPIGRSVRDTSVYVLSKDLSPVPPGGIGELWIGGSKLARGYLNHPALTAERFIPNPFAARPGERLYRTGDLVRQRTDGVLDYIGRADFQVKVRGFRIELGEIEAALRLQPGVRDAVVVTRDDAAGDKRLVAYLIARHAGCVSVDVVRDGLAATLPDYMVPSAIVVLERFPLTASDKIDRKALPAPDASAFAGDAEVAYVAPRGDVEEMLATVFRNVLALDRVGAHDDFFAIGGHSLLAARVVSRISAALGVAVPVRLIFDAPTIAALAQRLGSKPDGDSNLAIERHDPGRQRFPLSLAQERLVFLDRLEPGSLAYIIPFAVRLKGELRPAVLMRAFEEIVRRHEALRTTFEEDAGVSVQVIHEAVHLAWEQRDVTALVATGGQSALVEEIRREARRPFDLRRGPLLRTTLLEIGASEHVLVVSVHHIISDGWSIGIMARELEALYAAFSAGRESPLPDLAVHYGDYAVWERARLAEAALERQLAYWKGHLIGAPPALELPTDHARPLVQKHRGAVVRGHLSADVAERLARVARLNGATLYMTLLAALAAVLSRSTGQRDIVVATPIANRPRPETERIFGFFMNTVAIRIATSGEPTFEGMLARARDASLGAFANQDVPFDRVVQELNPVRDMSRNVIAQASLNLLNLSDTGFTLEGIITEPAGVGDVGSKYDLTLYAVERDGLRLQLVFDADLFDERRMARLLRRLERVLEHMASSPSSRIDDVSLVLDDERALLPDPTAPLHAREHRSVVQLFDDRVRDAAQRVAVADSVRSWTYAELGARSNQLAHWLRAQGIGEGDVVAVYAGRSALTVWALLAILKSGAAFTVLDATYPSARLAEQLHVAAPSAWISAVDSGSPGTELEMLMPSPERQVDLAAANEPWSSLPTTTPDVVVRPRTRAYVAFTSGTSGGPKGIAGVHGPLSHFVEWHAATHGLGPQDRFSALSGVAHDPFLRDIFTPLSVGAAICLPPDDIRREPEALAAWLANERISICHLTPSLGEVLAHSHATSLPELRWACFGGEALGGQLVRALRQIAPRARFVSFYGATETPQAMGYYPVPDEPPVGAVPIGRGIEGVQLLVLNAAGNLAGVDEEGEIVVRTPHLALGYFGAVAQGGFGFNGATADPSDRVYQTGDRGRFLADGNVQMLGRIDDQVKVRGFRVELGELEGVVRSLAGVLQAVAVLDERRRALVVYASGTAEPDALRQALRQRLPDYMVPSRVIMLESIPLTPAGKVDRRALPPLEDATPDSAGESPPSGSFEESIVEIWKDVLGLSDVARDANFFDVGGHSLLAMQITARIREAFDVEISVRTLFEAPTVTKLAERVVDAVLLAASPELLSDALDEALPRQEPTMMVRGSRVADATEHWMELLRGPFGASTIDAVAAATEQHPGVAITTVLRPLFIEASTCRTVMSAAEAVNRAVLIAADRLLRDQSFRHAIGFPAYMDPLLEIDRDASRPSIMARLDGLFDREGCIRFIEYNALPGGQMEQFEASRVLERAPIAHEFARRFRFRAPDPRDVVVEALIAETRERGRPLPARLAVAMATPPRNIPIPHEMWVPFAASRGCQVTFIDPAQLEVRDDGVFAEGERVDVLYMPFAALVKPNQFKALKGALQRGLITSMFGVSQALLCSSKLTFTVLSDPEHADMFDHDTQRALRQHVPWTRRVAERSTVFEGQRVDLIPFLAEHRDRFVLKPAGSLGGEGVVLGWMCDQAGWQTALDVATKRPHVVQERVDAPQEIFPMLVGGTIVEEARSPDFCPFIVNGRSAQPDGFVVRVSRTLHNTSSGASVAGLFVLPD